MSEICQTCGGVVDDAFPGAGTCPACLWGAAMSEPLREVEGLIEGHELLEEIARGGMGVVYRAKQLHPSREVALKMLLPADRNSVEFRDRFRLEARALAELDHPGILPLYHLGESGGIPFFTMKLASGGSLAQRLKSRSPLPPQEAAQLCRELAGAMSYAHSRGVLHRDIKPGNVLFGDRGEAYLADFGLAKLIGDSPSITVTARVMGTPCYMAPEVAEQGARAATTASDVYALGAVLYEMLAGRPPFQVEGMGAILRKIAEQEPARPSTLNAGVPRGLETICLTCLAKSPANRYASAAALCDDLNNWLEGRPLNVQPAGSLRRLAAWAARKPALAGTSGALLATLVGSGVWLTYSNQRLEKSLFAESHSRAAADDRVAFLLGDFGDRMEQMGRLDLLHAAWEDLEISFSNQNDLSRSQQLSVVRLQTRWARTLALQGEMDESLRRAKQAVSIAMVLNSAEVPGSGEACCDAMLQLADTRRERGEFELALTEAEKVASIAPGCALPDRWLGESALSRGRIFQNWSKKEESLQAALEARPYFARWQQSEPKAPLPLMRHCNAVRSIGSALTSANRPEEALPVFKEAELLADQLCALQSPPESTWLRERAQCIGWQSTALLKMGPEHATEARKLTERTLEIVRKLSEMEPYHGGLKADLGNSWDELGQTCGNLGDLPGEEECFKQRIALFSDIVDRAPLVRPWRMNCMGSYFYYAKWCLVQNDDPSARLAQAMTLFQKMLDYGFPLVQKRSAALEDHKGWCGQIKASVKALDDNKHLDVAVPFLRSALSQITPQIISGGQRRYWLLTRATLQRALADVYSREKRFEEAFTLNRAALNDRLQVFQSQPDAEPDLPGALGNAFRWTVKSHLDLDRIDEALKTANEAMTVWLANRKAAGDPALWASSAYRAAEGAIKKNEAFAAQGRSLAERAVAMYYEGKHPPASDKNNQMVYQLLIDLATPKPNPP